MQITTHFANDFGRDADSAIVVVAAGSDLVRLNYTSTRGIFTTRDIQMADRRDAQAYVLGYAPRMPTLIAGSTSLGISAAVLDRLRSTGTAPLTLIYSERLDRIACTLRATDVDIRVPMIIEDRVADIPAVRAQVDCAEGARSGSGTMLFVNDVNNPMLIESDLRFSWERRRRTERVTRVAAGLGMHGEMEQSLSTLGTYDVYGLHFDFDKSQLRPTTAQLVGEIAVMLHANANWIIQIAGHTDSLGDAGYNLNLSAARANSVRQALIDRGIAPARLKAAGFGESRPKADNDTFVGRAINRRVEFRRLDR
jgi:outer membrane protein OmpA-like peptidoglycan-associated protein